MATEARTLRPWLSRLLVATALLSCIALWLPQPAPPQAVTPWSKAATPQDGLRTAKVAPRTSAQESTPALPAQLSGKSIEPSVFDPFAGVLPPPPLPVAKAVAPVAEIKPAAPPVNYRYLGQMLDPSGQWLVYLSGPDGREVPVRVGTRLPEGYEVESIKDDGVRLRYPAFEAYSLIPIPLSQQGNTLFVAPQTP